MIPAGVALALTLAVAGTPDGRAAARVDAVPVPKTATAIRSTGELSDEVWSSLPPVDAFVQREPNDAGTPSQRTEFRVAYDETTLFVKVRAFDTDPDKIVTYLTRRDLNSPCDWIHLLIDSYHDRRTAYEFAVNPSGVKLDRYWFSDNNSDDSWDAVWDVTVSRDPQGWTAEFRIPFSQLRYTPSPSSTFGFAVTRQIGRLNETSTWPLLSRSANGYVSSFGELGGLTMTASPKKLELTPYTVADVTTQQIAGNPLLDGVAPGVSAGLDMKYAVTSGLTLTTTVNPDFGQVEADPAVVNLSAFETYFNERRPFFVEGSGNFNFNLDCNDGACSGLFYSRRVGRAPHGTDNLPDAGNVYTDVPSQTKILGAAKLTGRIGEYSIGVIEAVTERVTARIQDGTALTTQTVEPLTNYLVGRVRREFTNQSAIGFMLTNAKRQGSDSVLDVLPSSATTGGVDWDLRFKKRYSLTGYWAGSTVRGDVAAIDALQQDSRHDYQRPDLTSVTLDSTRTSLSGTSGLIGVSKIGGEFVHFNSNIGYKSPGFDINDVGFLRRADTRNIGNWIQFRSDRPNRWFRSRMINFNEYAGWNADGDRLYSGGNVNAHAVFQNNWSTGAGYNVNALNFDDRVTRGGPGVYQEGGRGVWYYLNSDNRRIVSLQYFGSWFVDSHGSQSRDFGPEFTIRPMPALMLTAGVRVSTNLANSQWVGEVTDTANHYVFSRLNQTTVALTGRLNYTLTPNLSIQLYAQPFVSAGDYSGFKQIANPRSLDYNARYAPYAYDTAANGDPDFNVKSFRTTNVLRWEYKPGSTLFVVWQQARENDDVPGGFNAGRDIGNIFGAPPKNVFLVKLAYWLNF